MKRLSPIARQISTEALSAELAAERNDWRALQDSYERLALQFAEFRLTYVNALARRRGAAPDPRKPLSRPAAGGRDASWCDVER